MTQAPIDTGPGFLWIHEDEVGGREYPLYGPLANFFSPDGHTLEGWHTEGDTLFLTLYSRD